MKRFLQKFRTKTPMVIGQSKLGTAIHVHVEANWVCQGECC